MRGSASVAFVTSTRTGALLRASDMSPDELRILLADYHAFEQLHMFRQLVVTRLAVLAVVATGAGRFSGLLTTVASFIVATLFAVSAVVVWSVEFAAKERVARRLARLPHAESLADGGMDEPPPAKVIKSS